MSVHVMSWVLRNSDARLGDRLVLLVLADHAKDDGTSAWPSVATIADEARLSRRGATYCLGNLERAGAIVKTGQSRHGTNVWTVVMAEQQALDTSTPDTQDAHSLPAQILRGVQDDAQTSEAVAPDPSENHPSTPPVAPPQGGAPSRAVHGGGNGRRRRRRREDPSATLQTVAGRFAPDDLVDPWTRQVYANLGVNLPDGATHADAERACAEWTHDEDAAA